MEIEIIALLCFFAFLAGFVDAVVGGGGLIQLPAVLILLPQYAVGTVVGSLKIPAFTGVPLLLLRLSVVLNCYLLSVISI